MRQKARLTFRSFFRIVAQNTAIYVLRLLRFVLVLTRVIYFTHISKIRQFSDYPCETPGAELPEGKYETDEIRNFVINQIMKL